MDALTGEGWGIEVTRDGRSMFGPGSGWLLDAAGNERTFETLGEARAEAERLNRILEGGAYSYAPRRIV